MNSINIDANTTESVVDFPHLHFTCSYKTLMTSYLAIIIANTPVFKRPLTTSRDSNIKLHSQHNLQFVSNLV